MRQSEGQAVLSAEQVGAAGAGVLVRVLRRVIMLEILFRTPQLIAPVPWFKSGSKNGRGARVKQHLFHWIAEIVQIGPQVAGYLFGVPNLERVSTNAHPFRARACF